jgi:hypothetical protein
VLNVFVEREYFTFGRGIVELEEVEVEMMLVDGNVKY